MHMNLFLKLFAAGSLQGGIRMRGSHNASRATLSVAVPGFIINERRDMMRRMSRCLG